VSLLSDVGDQLVAWMLSYGYPILVLVLVLGALGLPLPAGLVATVAGTLVA
jgi:membrane-associated protein